MPMTSQCEHAPQDCFCEENCLECNCKQIIPEAIGQGNDGPSEEVEQEATLPPPMNRILRRLLERWTKELVAFAQQTGHPEISRLIDNCNQILIESDRFERGAS